MFSWYQFVPSWVNSLSLYWNIASRSCKLCVSELSSNSPCSSFSSTWYGSAVPGERAVSCGGHYRKKAAALCVNVCSRNTVSSRRSTIIGDRAFFLPAPRIWNSLPSSVTDWDTRHLQAPAEDTSFSVSLSLHWTALRQLLFCNADCTLFLNFVT